MSQAVQNSSTVLDLSRAAIAAHARLDALCAAMAPDDALSAPLDDYAEAMAELADLKAGTQAERRAKAEAVMVGMAGVNGTTTVIDGDGGVAMSLIRDLLAMPSS